MKRISIKHHVDFLFEDSSVSTTYPPTVALYYTLSRKPDHGKMALMPHRIKGFQKWEVNRWEWREDGLIISR